MPDAPASPRRTAGRRVAVAVALLAAVVLAWCGAFAGLLWADLRNDEREAWRQVLQPRAGLLLLFLLALPPALWAVVRPWVAAWPRAVQRLREEVDVVSTAHAGHRVGVPSGPRELRELAGAIDGLAMAHAALYRDVQARVEAAGAALAAETQRLAALMAELTMGVLVCNRDGRVLLYNARAAALLGGGEGKAPAAGASGGAGGDGAPLGLGRTVGSLLDPGAIDHAWQQVLRRLEQGAAEVVSHFVTARRGAGEAGSSLLRVQMVPTRDEHGEPGGYLLLIDDVTRSVQEHGRRDALLQRLTEGTRAALGNLRAAAQALHQYPAMEVARRARLTSIVHEEAERLAAQLGDALREPAGAPATAWPLEDMQAGDLAWALQRCLRASGTAVECRFDGRGADRWLVVDSHAVVQMLAWLVGRLGAELDVHEVVFEVAGEATAVRLEIGWTGAALPPGALGDWEVAAVPAGAATQAASVREVLDRHGAELWSQTAVSADPEGSAEARHRLCLQFGASRGEGPRVRARPTGGRPIAYDFDLFHQAGQNPRLDETPLAALTYTVFDTETTGLRPSEGDEIIAIGAVRIVNAHLLEDERFDRRVRPRRAVRASALAVHGISTESLAGEPPLEQVLPSFARFCEDAVLVAHNAAFDMRFLELARERTGVRFDQPVLDTMLLSAAVLPGHRADEHHLEQIAARLGVPVAGRHQALGDALTTARVLLKLLPLLAERGITTLAQARSASQSVAQADESY